MRASVLGLSGLSLATAVASARGATTLQLINASAATPTCQSELCHECVPNAGPKEGGCCNSTWTCVYDQVFEYNICLPPYHWICE